jgi:hypothetical protein
MPGTTLAKKLSPDANGTIVITDKYDKPVEIQINIDGVISLHSINNCHLSLDLPILAMLATIFGNSIRIIEDFAKNDVKNYVPPCIGQLYRLLELKKNDFVLGEDSGKVSCVYLGIEFTNDQYVKILAAKFAVSDAFINNFGLICDIVKQCPTHSTGKYFIYTEQEFTALLEGPYKDFSNTEILADLF